MRTARRLQRVICPHHDRRDPQLENASDGQRHGKSWDDDADGGGFARSAVKRDQLRGQRGLRKCCGGDLYAECVSPVPLTVTLSDFTLSSGARNVIVKSGQSTSIPLLLDGPNGDSATVSLNCLPSMPNFQCIASPATQTARGATTTSLMVNAYINTTRTAASVNAINRGLLEASASFAFALLFMLPNRKELRKQYGVLQLCCVLLAAGTFIAGCGGGSGPVAPPPPQTINTPPGTYYVVITASSGKITHNTNVIVEAQ
jgi:hypothetical protein